MAGDRGSALPAALRVLTVALGAVALVSVFIALRFPYDRLAEFISAEVRRSSGVSVTLGELGPMLQLAGPGIRATDIRIANDGSAFRFDRASLRAAWSTSWVLGRPALHIDLAGPLGRISGTWTAAPEPAWDGVLEDIDLEAPFVGWMLPNLQLTGSGDAVLDVAKGLPGAEGRVRFELSEGSIAFGDFPLAIPFERIEGSLTLGDESFLSVETLTLDGPMMTAEVTGVVESAPRFEEAPLNLQVQIQAQPAIQIGMASAGVRFDKQGSARVRITGTPAHPRIH